eukprot:TRINITY_DN105_c0_g1_i1.p1 TRINITY_DN105_c0_g1~~TRINITY_DN105_c0_g1_i1.p1  ORF type:complete len:261 (-),score=52.79 TRINITY_DN105_c0_g1_i1:502-1284(-)
MSIAYSSFPRTPQEGLKARCSRMDVELPYGARLGVEGVAKDAPVDVEQSDRELARLFVEMFDPIGDATVVAFRTDKQAATARNLWGLGSYKGTVQSMEPKKSKVKKSGKKSRAGGFAKKLEAALGDDTEGPTAVVPAGTEVFVLVAPQEKELQMVENLDLGRDCLCILLNARLDSDNTPQRTRLRTSFEGVFYLRAIGDASNDELLYRSYPKAWTLARKPKVGPPKVVATFESRPSAEEVAEAAAEGAAAASKGLFGGLF